MRTLGIDTSNYATSLAVYDSAGGAPVMLKRFLPVKQGGLGLRQSDAAGQTAQRGAPPGRQTVAPSSMSAWVNAPHCRGG